MSSNEKLAIAAHLHVLMRRKTGRVTDIEWMAANPAYAAEIIRLAHQKAAEGGHDDLGILADKLEAAMALPEVSTCRPPAQHLTEVAMERHAQSQGAQAAVPLEPGGNHVFGDSQMGPDGMARPNAPRYVKGLRQRAPWQFCVPEWSRRRPVSIAPLFRQSSAWVSWCCRW